MGRGGGGGEGHTFPLFSAEIIQWSERQLGRRPSGSPDHQNFYFFFCTKGGELFGGNMKLGLRSSNATQLFSKRGLNLEDSAY